MRLGSIASCYYSTVRPKKEWGILAFFRSAVLRLSERTARKIPPLAGRVASGVPRKPDDGRGDLRSAFAFVERNCDPVRHLFRRLRRHLPLEGKDLGAELVPFLRPSKRAARKIPPLEGRVASGVPRKPDDGRGDLRSASASVERNCDPVRHLFRRLRRHLPLKGKDFVPPSGRQPGGAKTAGKTAVKRLFLTGFGRAEQFRESCRNREKTWLCQPDEYCRILPAYGRGCGKPGG